MCFYLLPFSKLFLEFCYQTYGLDCACYFTASSLSGDAFLKVCKLDLKLVTDREHLDFVQQMIRGGKSLAYARRFYEAKKYLYNLTIAGDLYNFFDEYPLAPSREVVNIGTMNNKQIDSGENWESLQS